MRLYRLSTATYADRLDGEGAAIRGARWNPRRVPMIYTAAEPALAVLEVLAHFNARHEMPEDTVLVSYELSGRSGIRRPGRASLPAGWDAQGPPYSRTTALRSSHRQQCCCVCPPYWCDRSGTT